MLIPIRYQTARLLASNPHSLTCQVVCDAETSEADNVPDAVYAAINAQQFDSFNPPLHDQLQDIIDSDRDVDLILIERILWERARVVTKHYATGGMFDWDAIEAADSIWRNIIVLVGILEYGIRTSRPS